MTQRRGWHEGTIFKLDNGKWRSQITVKGNRFSHSGNSRAECTSWLQSVREVESKKQSNPELKTNPERIPA